jgi:hypothetical protein
VWGGGRASWCPRPLLRPCHVSVRVPYFFGFSFALRGARAAVGWCVDRGGEDWVGGRVVFSPCWIWSSLAPARGVDVGTHTSLWIWPLSCSGWLTGYSACVCPPPSQHCSLPDCGEFSSCLIGPRQLQRVGQVSERTPTVKFGRSPARCGCRAFLLWLLSLLHLLESARFALSAPPRVQPK